MAEVKVLIEGYTSADVKDNSGEEKTCSTISLVKSGNIIMVVDPGVLESQELLKNALTKEGIGINDVNYVFVTHSHADHYRNVGMFPKAKLLEYFALWNGNVAQEWKEQFAEDIKIIKTPGHSHTGLTLLADTKEGVVAICGDIFWKENSPDFDPYADDMELLKQNREMILKIADYIVPGHAGMYKTKK
ncbi:MAG: MBL fold metallo-hydrolase [bacterium]|nr:MBL fold metallo-hydrolase [bacterium]